MAEPQLQTSPNNDAAVHDIELANMPSENAEHTNGSGHGGRLPRFNHNGHRVTRGIHPDGESGRSGVHPVHFLRVCINSSSTASKTVNVLWPFVPAAIAIHFRRPDLHNWVFALNYIAMVPTANLIGFAGQELARKLPKVLGVVLETFLGSIVEIILFMVLLSQDQILVIQAAILGSILANLLLCLGLCFFVGGLRYKTQAFEGAISEVGSGLLLVAGFGLAIPAAFSVGVRNTNPEYEAALLDDKILKISRATAIVLLVAFFTFVFFQVRSHHNIYHGILEADEEKDADRQRDLKKRKLTLVECGVALVIALTCVSLHAIFLVEQIPDIIVDGNVSDMFMGLVLVPVIEKFAEHLTAIDEAWDNQMNFALAHVLGATLQTALLNSSLVVIVGWGLDKSMNLNFPIFQIVLIILAILVVGNFLRDKESNYLEGALCVFVYILIAITAYEYPNEATGLKGEPAAPKVTATPEGSLPPGLLMFS